MAEKKTLTRADPVLAYAQAVISGREITGKPVHQACERHIRDLRTGRARGLVWQPETAQRACDFFTDILRLDNDEPFVLHPSQQFIVGSLWGWHQKDGTRRFRTAYLEMAKGAGKTCLVAGMGLLGLIGDNEPAAEVYSAATTREQARIAFTDAKRMVERSSELQEVISVMSNHLETRATNGVFRPISAEHRGLDGKRVHMALIDEIHEHSTDIVVNKMRAGTKNRKNGLLVEITNAGHDRTTVCWQHHLYSLQILDGTIDNDSWFAYVCALDACEKCAAEGKMQPNPECPQCDSWRNPTVWRKANPLLGITISERYLQEQVAEAVGMPSKENIVRRLNFCEWTEQSERWLAMDKWDACGAVPINMVALEGRSCYAGLDLSATTDFTALCLVFPPDTEEDAYLVLPFFWLPARTVKLRRDKGLSLDVWVKDGLLEVTDGEVVDYQAIRRKLQELADTYQMREIAYDPWNATSLVSDLQDDGFTMVEIRQGYGSLSAPSKELEKLILSTRIAHGGHPILRWMAANVAREQDAAGNIKPSKAKSSEKIDGIVAMILALARAVVDDGGNMGSIYDAEARL